MGIRRRKDAAAAIAGLLLLFIFHSASKFINGAIASTAYHSTTSDFRVRARSARLQLRYRTHESATLLLALAQSFV